MRNIRKPVRSYIFLLCTVLSIYGFYNIAILYNDFRIPYGRGIIDVPRQELTFYIWYLFMGTLSWVFLSLFLYNTSIPKLFESAVRGFFARTQLFGFCTIALLFCSIVVFRTWILQGTPIADDESTYVFIAKTLLTGRVVNALPGDNEFFENQFIILNSSGWFGKYPIGHPVLLALGEAAGSRDLVVPLLTCATLLITWMVGRVLFDKLTACIAVCLLLVSPQFVFTGATQLSQPTSMLCMMIGLYIMQELKQKGQAWRVVMAGVVWGFGVLVRPFPGGLYLLSAAAIYIIQTSKEEWVRLWREKVLNLLLAGVPVFLVAMLFLWINRQQSGKALQTGYHTVHGGLGIFGSEPGQLSSSIVSAFLRQNFWLFGWPVSFCFVVFARGKSNLALFWSLIAATVMYRVIVPKTVVATTGPVYVAEIVPLLALGTASGMIHVKRRLERFGLNRAKESILSIVLSAILIGTVMFIPVQLTSINRSSRSWLLPYRKLALEKPGKAIVFAEYMVKPDLGLTWAYYPPNPSPTLDDSIIFVRLPLGKNAVDRMTDFWQRRFPDRSAWTWVFSGNRATLTRLLQPTK